MVDQAIVIDDVFLLPAPGGHGGDGGDGEHGGQVVDDGGGGDRDMVDMLLILRGIGMT